ncbi:Uncharacterised protein [uncultured archaeon]|nr:Uncharacterised protein [uncultured archaeon]
MQEVDNVLRIFEEAKKAIEIGNFSKIRELSNQTINTASRTQDPDNIAVAVIVYSIGKILERTDYQKYPGWKKYYQTIKDSIDEIITDLDRDNMQPVSDHLKDIRDSINHLSGNLKAYVQEVFRKASINKASKIYEHGISMETTAKLLGLTLWEVASYAGTKSEQIPETEKLDVKSRIKLAEEFFS